jgi:surface antigen
MRGTLQKIAIGALLSLALAACTSTPLPPEMNSSWSDRPSFVRSDNWTECVPYARQTSGIQIYGDAHTWWDQAAGRYAREPVPQSGALMVLHGYAGPKRGHLATVHRVVSEREIRVDHANWLNDGNLYLNSPVIDVSPNNDWSMVRVYNNRDDHLGVKNYNVRGFISSTRVASAE